MVRFSWHVEDGLQAYLPPGAYTQPKDTPVRHAACEIEIPQSKETLEAVITLPVNYLDADKMKETGIVLGHGNDEAEWKGKLLTEIAVFLASQGFIVIRYCCKHKEQRRQRMFEKALDACATSPYARAVTKWVLAGFGSGGRVAAVVGGRCRGNIAGFVMLSYPLKEPIPQQTKVRRGDDDSSPPPKSSESPLFDLDKPILFLLGDGDEFCSAADLKSVASQLPAPDVRVELFEDADGEFKSTQGKGPAASVMRRLCTCILDFITALEEESLDECKLGRLGDLPQAAQLHGEAGMEAHRTPTASPVISQAAPQQESAHHNSEAVSKDASAPGPAAGLQDLGSAGQHAAPQLSRTAPAAVGGSGLPPQVYQQVLSSQMLQNPQQAQQLLTVLRSQRAQVAQQNQGQWSSDASSQPQPHAAPPQNLGALLQTASAAGLPQREVPHGDPKGRQMHAAYMPHTEQQEDGFPPARLHSQHDPR